MEIQFPAVSIPLSVLVAVPFIVLFVFFFLAELLLMELTKRGIERTLKEYTRLADNQIEMIAYREADYYAFFWVFGFTHLLRLAIRWLRKLRMFLLNIWHYARARKKGGD